MLVLDAHTCDCVLLHRKNSKHSSDSFWDKCFMIVPLFFTALAYQLEEFLGSLSHINASPTVLPILFYMHGTRECYFFWKLFHGSLRTQVLMETDINISELEDITPKGCWTTCVKCPQSQNVTVVERSRPLFRFATLTAEASFSGVLSPVTKKLEKQDKFQLRT